MDQIRIENIKSLEEQRDLHLTHVEDIKAEAENRLTTVKSNLEKELSNQKVGDHSNVFVVQQKFLGYPIHDLNLVLINRLQT